MTDVLHRLPLYSRMTFVSHAAHSSAGMCPVLVTVSLNWVLLVWITLYLDFLVQHADNVGY